METWWDGISTTNKVFVCSAIVFTLLFVSQLIMSLWGVDSDGDGDVGDAGFHGDLGDLNPGEVHELGSVAFTLLSTRSIIAFGTLFSWAGSIYLATGKSILVTLIYSFIWGALAMVGVSLILRFILRMQEQGNVSVAWALGEKGTVYINIPSDGYGKVRLNIKGIMRIVNARSANGTPIMAGAMIKVVGVVNQNTLDVVELWNPEGE